jgi:hypothetical protein
VAAASKWRILRAGGPCPHTRIWVPQSLPELAEGSGFSHLGQASSPSMFFLPKPQTGGTPSLPLCRRRLPHRRWLCRRRLPHRRWLCRRRLPHRGWLPKIILPWRTLADRRQGCETPHRTEKPCATSLLPAPLRQRANPGFVFSVFACETVEPNLTNSISKTYTHIPHGNTQPVNLRNCGAAPNPFHIKNFQAKPAQEHANCEPVKLP